MRKPQPLDTEIKNIVCDMSGIMLWLEIQEGKDQTRKEDLIRLEVALVCVMRGVTDTASDYSYIESPRDKSGPNDTDECAPPEYEVRKGLYLADSWFGPAKTAENVAQSEHHCTMIIKTAHSRSLNKWLDKTMKYFPGWNIDIT